MAYGEYGVRSFSRGLHLASQPDVVGPDEAIDLLNVTFTERGAVRQRDGYAKLNSVALAGNPRSIFPFYTGTTKRVLVDVAGEVYARDETGAADSDTTGFASFPSAGSATTSYVRYGSPSVEAVYMANGVDRVWRFAETGNFTQPAGLSGETGMFLAAWEGRLIIARESGTTAGNNPSSVRFSDPADPENFTADLYEDLHPGDGEKIQGMATWRELLFVFKESKFFIFYGIGVDETGEADPQWRVVDTGVGLAAPRGLVAARDGLYFLDRKGVYRTTGGEPQQVSSAIDPFFTGDLQPFFRSNALNAASINKAAMSFHREQVFLSVPTGSASANDRILVFDPRFSWWSLYDIPAADLCVFRPSSDEELVIADSGQAYITRHSADQTADNMATDNTGGTAITSRWRSGWSDLGDPHVKRVREQMLWGEGVVDVKVTTDFENSGETETISFGSGTPDTWGDGSSSADTWGGGSDASDLWGPVRQITPRARRIADRGTVFSIAFSNQTLNVTWAIHRLDWHPAGSRHPSVPQTEVA